MTIIGSRRANVGVTVSRVTVLYAAQHDGYGQDFGVFYHCWPMTAFIAVTTKVLAEMGEERVGDGFLVKVISFLVRNVRKHFIHLEGRVGTIQ